VQPDRVVVAADAGELGVERGRVGDPSEVRPVALQVREEALDVRLVGRSAGAAVMLRDRHQSHELTGIDGFHLRPVV